MTGPDEAELTKLSRLDPTRHDAPPAPGSSRFNTILERAMTHPTLSPVHDLPPLPAAAEPRTPRRWRAWASPSGSGDQLRIAYDAQLSPFAQAADALIRAAVVGTRIAQVGQDEVRGVSATHFRLTLSDAARRALRALPAADLAWFALEHPEQVGTVDIWVADKLIRKIVVRADRRTSVAEFFDFGAPIVIKAPTR